MKFFQLLFALAFPLFLTAQTPTAELPTYEPTNAAEKGSIFKKNVTIPAGTEIFFQTQNQMDVARTQVGQLISLTVAQDVVIDGKVVVATNTNAVGKVTAVSKPTGGSPQRLTVVVESVRDVLGQTLVLNGAGQDFVGSRPGRYETLPNGQLLRGFALNAHRLKF